MVAEVTAQGLLIPPALLGNASRVEILREQGRLVITPISDANDESLWSEDDPIWQLGQNAVDDDIVDASENLDAYLYKSTDEE